MLPSGAGSATSFSVSVKPLAGGRVVDVDRPGQRARRAGARLVAAEHRVHHRRRARCGRVAAGRRAARSASGSRPRWPRRRRGTGAASPCGGKGISKARSSATVASASSLSCSQAASLARRSIDSVLASAPRPRGCSAPLTQTSKGCGAAAVVGRGSSPTKSAKSPKRVLDHEGPGRVAGRQLGPAGPAQDWPAPAPAGGPARSRWLAPAMLQRGAAGVGAARRRRSAPSPARCSAGRWPGPSGPTLPGLAGTGPGSRRTGSRPAR